jgi:phosphate transport system permease protein
MPQASELQKLDKRPPGEAQVYLAGMGLAIGIVMILWLLVLVISNGLAAFWPRKVVEIELKDGRKLFGEEIAREEIRDVGVVTGHQLKFFTGNRDLLGQSTIFVPEADIVTKTDPTGVIVLERLEWGDVIAYPNQLVLQDGQKIEADDPVFAETLKAKVKEYEKLWGKIGALEKGEIGDLSAQVLTQERELRLIRHEVSIGKRTTEEAANDEAVAKAEIERLNQENEVLMAKAQEMRSVIDKESLSYTLADGKEKSVELGELVSFYFPNELSGWGRFTLFLSHMWGFLSNDPRESNTEGGVFPCIFGTFFMTVIMSLLVTPLGVMAAVYLREYAKQGAVVRLVRISVNNLAGVPSIVFGVFGLGFFVYIVGGGIDTIFYPGEAANGKPVFGSGNILWASLTLSLLTLPVVIVATEEALASVPRGLREASLACGASKWQTIQRIILPSASPGILTGVILAMARGAGEVAPLMVVGVVKLAPTLPIDWAPPFGMDRKFMHLGFHIYDLGFQSPDSEAAKPMVFATTMLLILLVVVLNLTAILIRNHLRKKLAGSSF